MTEVDLLRCPFCGAKDELEIWNIKGLWVVHCANCGCNMDWLDSKGGIIIVHFVAEKQM